MAVSTLNNHKYTDAIPTIDLTTQQRIQSTAPNYDRAFVGAWTSNPANYLHVAAKISASLTGGGMVKASWLSAASPSPEIYIASLSWNYGVLVTTFATDARTENRVQYTIDYTTLPYTCHFYIKPTMSGDTMGGVLIECFADQAAFIETAEFVDSVPSGLTSPSLYRIITSTIV